MVNLFVSGSNTDFIFVNFLSIFLEVITLLSKQFYFIYFLAVFFVVVVVVARNNNNNRKITISFHLENRIYLNRVS